jgi:DNA-binding response OmpR family regulator
MTVLLVEDDAMVRLTITEFFEAVGVDFLEAGNAEEAFAILSNPSQPVDVLVTDLDLGPGESGLSLATRARHQRPQLQVIYETGSPEMLAGRAFSTWERVFYKPFDPATLASTVQALDSLRCPGQRRQRPIYLKTVASSL